LSGLPEEFPRGPAVPTQPQHERLLAAIEALEADTAAATARS
jgi:hypothetical protein